MKITKEQAKMILEMADVCFSEGLLKKEWEEIIYKVAEKWPDLYEQYYYWRLTVSQ